MDKIENSRKKILQDQINPQNGGVFPVVPPLDWNAKEPFDGSEGKQSPEGQGFVILMHIAWKNYLLNSQQSQRKRIRL